MKMLLDNVFLTCQLQIGQARSTNSVYHILQGKPSIQTIQDIHLFKLENYYGIYKKLSKTDYSLMTERLIAEGYLLYDAETITYSVTKSGEELVSNARNQMFFQGYQYKQIDDIFQLRLLLLIQVWTNSKHTHFKFIPIVDNPEVEQWVKQYYYETKDNLDVLLAQLYDEITNILKTLSSHYAEVFVDQLTGYKHIGLTVRQLSNQYADSIHNIYLINRHVIHSFIRSILHEPEQFPVLKHVIGNLQSLTNLTDSTKQTFHLLNQNKTLEQIAQIRRLRINTIYDHIVEIALVDENFSIITYVPLKVELEIMNAIAALESYRLKDIKQAINPQISYFQIRLVLTKIENYEIE